MDHATETPSTATSHAAALPATPDLGGKTLGDFRLLRRLGQGGMGQVYLAEQLSLKRKVAVKIMRTDTGVSVASLDRFKAEAEVIARITHANIVGVYAIGEQAGLHYMALEYVEGRNLREHLAKKGPPDSALALSIMRQAAAGLQRASEHGIIHRDIKPENILLTRRGEVKVADFGLSRCFDGEQAALNLTQSGVALGTPLYMSPEQIEGLPIDPRTDMYSLGVTCYHMLAGQPPFRGKTAFELALQHVKSEPEPLAQARPDLPPQLCEIVHKMMAKAPENRYQTFAELLKDLARVREMLNMPRASDGQTQVNEFATLAVPAISHPSRRTAPARQFPWRVVTALAVAVGFAAGIGLAVLRNKPGEALVRSVSSSSALPSVPNPPVTVTTELPLVLEPDKSEFSKHEKFLKDTIREYSTGALPRQQLALKACAELGILYLDQNRWDDADKFFGDLGTAGTWQLKSLGRLGKAIVMARQNRPAESNKLFGDVLIQDRNKQGLEPTISFLLDQPHLRYHIGRALDFNKANATPQSPFPPNLEFWRDPPKLKVEGRGKPADAGKAK